MDAFYASVEQRDRPAFKGKPVIVGGDPGKRGVVAACSYEARRYGIKSAMPASVAFRLCPHGIFLRPRFDVYRQVSRRIREIFFEYTDLVEPLSLDEAFLDVTENKKKMLSATLIALEIKREIYEKIQLTSSAGVSFNKFLAKVASDFNKPDGITIVTPDQADAFIEKLPIRKFFGVGEVTEKKMHALGIRTGADLRKKDKNDLILHFGKSGRYFYEIAHGMDMRQVIPDRVRKSIGKEVTLQEDTDDLQKIMEILTRLALKLEAMIRQQSIEGMTITLKVKYFDFQMVTRSLTDSDPIKHADLMMQHVGCLLKNTDAGKKKIRLLGITISNFLDDTSLDGRPVQLPLPFDTVLNQG